MFGVISDVSMDGFIQFDTFPTTTLGQFSEPPFKSKADDCSFFCGLSRSNVPSLCLFPNRRTNTISEYLTFSPNFPSFHISLRWHFLPNKADEPAASLSLHALFRHDSHTELLLPWQVSNGVETSAMQLFPPTSPTHADFKTFCFSLWASSAFLPRPWLLPLIPPTDSCLTASTKLLSSPISPIPSFSFQNIEYSPPPPPFLVQPPLGLA